MTDQIVGKKIQNEASFKIEAQKSSDKSKNSERKIKKIENARINAQKIPNAKRITQSVQNKENLIKTIDNLLDYQLEAKKRVAKYKKEQERVKSQEKMEKSKEKKNYEQEIPSFLEKTKMRLANYSRTTLKKKIEQKQELKKRMEKLDELKFQAKKEIEKLPKKNFKPNQPFTLNFKTINELKQREEELIMEKENIQCDYEIEKFTTSQHPVEQTQVILENPQIFPLYEKKNKNFSQPEENSRKEFQNKMRKNDKLQTKSTNEKEKDIGVKIKEKTLKKKLKEEKIMRETAVNNKKSAKLMILEQKIREKEKEISEYEELMKNGLKNTDLPAEIEIDHSLEEMKKYENEQKDFFSKIHNKLNEDLKDFPSPFHSNKKSFIENNQHEEAKKQKIDKFLKKSNSETKRKTSPLDHILFVNSVIDKKTIEMKNKNESVNLKQSSQKLGSLLDLENFENDIFMYKNLYSKSKSKNHKKENKNFESPNKQKQFTKSNLRFEDDKNMFFTENIFNTKQNYFPEENDFGLNDDFLEKIINGNPKDLFQKKELNIFSY